MDQGLKKKDPESQEFKSIRAEELSAVIGQDHVAVVDIRDQVSYQADHIPGALSLISDQEVEEFLNRTARTQMIVCCCYHGISSRKAASFFRNQGFADVYNLEGGFEAWRMYFQSKI